jgi:hypothetical protein
VYSTFSCDYRRVAQLEQENARLLALAQSSSSRDSSPASDSNHAKSNTSELADKELTSLRSLLAQSRARSAELENEVNRLRTSGSTTSSSDSGSDAGSPGGQIQVKRENLGIDAIPKRTGAGLFGVVLLCALPSLLSLPAPAVPYAASRFGFNHGSGAAAQTESLLDWTGMDVDIDGNSGSRRKVNLPLSFLNGQQTGASDILQGFASDAGSGFALSPSPEYSSTEAEFDVSLVPSATEGKIRVRIESPSEPGLISGGSSPPSSLGSPALGFTHTSPSEGWDLDFAPEHSQGIMWDAPPPAGANVDVSMFASQPSSVSASGRRRVRIALKSGPVAGAEGGEWEVEVR